MLVVHKLKFKKSFETSVKHRHTRRRYSGEAIMEELQSSQTWELVCPQEYVILSANVFLLGLETQMYKYNGTSRY